MDNKAGKIGRSFKFHEEFDDGRRLMSTWAEGVCEVDVGDEEMVPNAYTMSSGAGAPDNSSRDEPPQRFRTDMRRHTHFTNTTHRRICLSRKE